MQVGRGDRHQGGGLQEAGSGVAFSPITVHYNHVDYCGCDPGSI